MAKIAKNLTDLIGNTPMMELAKYSRAEGGGKAHRQAGIL